MPTTTKTVDWASLVRHHDPDYDNIGPGNKAGFAPYTFGGRVKKWTENKQWDFSKTHLPPCGTVWDDEKIWSDKLTWCDGDGQTTRSGFVFDLVEKNWPGTLDGCHVNSEGQLIPSSICGGPVSDLCPYLVPEFTYTSIVFDAGAIVTGIVEDEIEVDGSYKQYIKFHTVQNNLDSIPWRIMLPGQIITAQFIQYRITVNTQ